MYNNTNLLQGVISRWKEKEEGGWEGREEGRKETLALIYEKGNVMKVHIVKKKEIKLFILHTVLLLDFYLQ